ncbi:PREDICTED: zinc finger protein DZIP1L [Ceratosolen solmsi marchali]|uniref:Zinc finger protein DZIP1L n=1 Tax=Ceratosolen solmsi marchali TaxID=326594 RepID=A0AAJ7E2R6_9HYME|nr:PREDICTED: zinc finger protein DZIP1L [Ceratosolen solmsi marchali]
MAFSFRAGTNWCHDFPKLARESGFYFNMHATRVRVDWNRISSIDIDRVIRERDFQIVDENVNNVIDYYLESEYDVKILDPNFVKLFRLAQLAVEYLLYCKQYLDQSVVILKEELKYKIEENIKMKEEVMKLQNSIRDIKEKLKEKNKCIETKSDIRGEIHKCPYCPKTFISASFANAHLIRRHSNISEALSSSSPVNDEYRAETEKLHNEIKTLKERLNQTERVIRNESNKLTLQNEISNKEKGTDLMNDGVSLQGEQYRRYQDEMSDLKTMLFTEIRNIKKKENNSNQHENATNHEGIKELANQQESEIQRLKNQLQEHLTSNKNEVEVKLSKQEEYWKSKIEHLESQHRSDIENLFGQMKVTQESAMNMKAEYEGKVSFLEQQSIDQSKLLTAQSEQLKSLTKDIQGAQSIKSTENDIEIKKFDNQRTECINESAVDKNKATLKYKKIKDNTKQPTNNLKFNESYYRLLRNKKGEASPRMKSHNKLSGEYHSLNQKDKKPERGSLCKIMTKAGMRYSSLNESESSESSTDIESEFEFEEETDGDTSYDVTHTSSTNDEMQKEMGNKIIQRTSPRLSLKTNTSSVSVEIIKGELQDAFESKLKNLGIDPEWSTIPIATFNEKMESIKHQQNILSKKHPKYEQIRRKLLEEIIRRINVSEKCPKRFELEKKSFLNKTMKNVKSKALKAFHDFKVQKSNDTSTSVVSSKNSTPRESQTMHKLSLELLPNKPTQLDIQEMKRQIKSESDKKQKRYEPVTRSKKSNFHNKTKMNETVVEPVLEPSKYIKKLHRSYQSIEEFLKDIKESPKLDMPNTKVALSPSSTIKSILEDSSPGVNESETTKPDTTWAPASPKNNKSVLKSTSGSMGNIVKKKVLFDLEKDSTSEKKCTSTKSIGEIIEKEYNEIKEFNDIGWDFPRFCETFSIVEEQERVTRKKSSSTENIQLKTSQSEKIAEISRKIQEKLETARRKPLGSIEAMFSSKTLSADNDIIEMTHSKQSSMDMMNSILDYSTSQVDIKAQSNASQVPPRPAPRRQLFETKDIDLNTNINDLLPID